VSCNVVDAFPWRRTVVPELVHLEMLVRYDSMKIRKLDDIMSFSGNSRSCRPRASRYWSGTSGSMSGTCRALEAFAVRRHLPSTDVRSLSCNALSASASWLTLICPWFR